MDYKKLGFKCGIEIHQRLDTNKLFCDCSSSMQEEPCGEVKRKLRAVPGEMGEVDPAALYEYLRNRNFIYKVYPSESCDVELDEEPPHEVREEALEISLQVAKMLDCEVPEEIHPMRKTVIDGSNPSGFQRTMLVGLDGELETSEGSVGIENLCLEEESAQILNQEGNTVAYGLNRLGIPLVEIGTAPEIKNPAHAKEVAEKLGNMLRATGRVQRGIGTIRQDVNVSIENGARIEVKGLQELDILEETVRLEVERQASLLEIMEELNEREASVSEETISASEFFEDSDSDFAQRVLRDKGIRAFKLEGFDGILGRKISGDKTFGKELSEYAEAHGLGGIIHTDEDLDGYDLKGEFKELEQELGTGSEDVVIVMAGDGELDEAVESVKSRAKKFMEEVPEETRDSNQDGTTSYSRPLPGEARMYPETDVPPIEISEERLESIEIPKSLEEKKEKLTEELGLSDHLAEEVLDSRFSKLFEELNGDLDMEASTLANLMTVKLKDLKKRKDIPTGKVGSSTLEKVLKGIDEGEIPKDSFGEVLNKVLVENEKIEEVLDETQALDETDLEEIIEDILDEKEELLDDERASKKLMGPVMQKVGGKADGEKVSKILREKINEKK